MMLTEIYNGFAAVPRLIGLTWMDAAYFLGVALFVALCLLPAFLVIKSARDDEDDNIPKG
jgi:hypothetical protein